MTEWLQDLLNALLSSSTDLLPIAAIIIGFQVLVIQKPLPHPKQLLTGLIWVWLGMAFFLKGLEQALFPLGQLMAEQLTGPDFMPAAQHPDWRDYGWVYLFAASIGFSTTLAEPSLLAVAVKAQSISGGAIRALGLRIAVSIGVALGIVLGVFRIITGTELYYYIVAGYVLVLAQTAFAPKVIIGLAYDSGGVTTSTVTVPLVTALGLGLASNIPGRNPLLDGFGLIAFASLFPIMTVLAYAQIASWLTHHRSSGGN
ncbi:MAG: DUF1538 domain-containing protein [Methylococcales bacterium]|nr:DUF1538 domain-containing protein [Methylococcales bacterium]